MTLTDTQLILLSKASQREDGVVTLPETLKGAARDTTVRVLLQRGMIEETAGRGAPIWRDDPELGRRQLVITPSGLAALGVGEGDAPEPARKDELGRLNPADAYSGGRPKESGPAPLRPGSKVSLIAHMLSGDEGASIADLMAATGWQPHTVRASLTGLRQRGFALVLATRDGVTVYKRDSSPGPASDGARA